MSYLRLLYLLVYSGVQHTLCCDFALLIIVLCTLCSSFLWIVHFALPLLCSLTFIHNNEQHIHGQSNAMVNECL